MSLKLAFAGLVILLSAPAHAALQIAFDVNGAAFACVDNAACDTNPAVGVLELADQAIGGVTVNGSITASAHAGTEFLNTSSLSVINGNAFAVPITTTFGDTGYGGPITGIKLSGSGTWQTAIGSTILLSYAADAADAQGADFAGDLPGTILDTFSNKALTVVDSFSHNGASPFFTPGPFSMTESASGTLVAGGELINRGQTMVASPVPEPQTWLLGLIGFGLVAWLGRKARTPRYAAL
jgi:hypothetical protein